MTENWLSGICKYTGPGYDLPLGGYSMIPNWGPEKLARSWTVLDAESDVGSVEKRTSELMADDIIIGVTMNTNSIETIVAMYGRGFYQIREANGNALMTLDQWQEKFGTNGLGLVAIRNIRRKLSGAGIHF